MRCEYNFYLTSDRLLDIEFLFVDMGENIGWRAYIISDINYRQFGERSIIYTVTHRLEDSDADRVSKINRFLKSIDSSKPDKSIYGYICWSKPIYDLDDMHEVAKTWSEITAYYIRHGGSFGSIQPILKSRGIINL
ncbi:MAG: hypothetical protein J1E81_02460 [Eubacterium sp.]|nr:hypothetical protein [Eubacterium sp.]